MGQPSPSRRRVPQACDRCRVKKGKCDGKKPVCTRCALDGQMCMFSERKFSKDRVIPKGYVELLENRVEILETGLREALLRLNAAGGIQLPHSPVSNPPSPTSANFLDHAHDLTYNITQALKELQAMKIEREKGMYAEEHEHEHDHDHDHEHDTDHSEHGDSSASPRTSIDSTRTSSSPAKADDLATPLTSPANSPPPAKTLFLRTDVSQAPIQPRYTDSNLNFYQAYFERQTSNPIISNISTTGPFAYYDDLSLSWLDDTYELSLQSSGEFSFPNL